MQTSNFAKSGNHPNAVAICRYPPRRYTGRRYLDLAPPPWMLKLPEDTPNTEFERLYRKYVLTPLSPAQVLEDLGEDAILLCFEKDSDFCHRQIVARWFKETLGVSVPELHTPGTAKRAAQDRAKKSQTTLIT